MNQILSINKLLPTDGFEQEREKFAFDNPITSVNVPSAPASKYRCLWRLFRSAFKTLDGKTLDFEEDFLLKNGFYYPSLDASVEGMLFCVVEIL